jgi:hypothetical protein
MKKPKSADNTVHPTTAHGPVAAASASKVSPAPPRKLSRLKKTFFALIAVCLFFGLIEFLLAIVFWLGIIPDRRTPTFGNHDREMYLYSNYPANPDEYIKIAVFGGSAAAGEYAWRSFDTIVELELTNRFPSQKLYIKNYARSGYPFHRHQAEYVKILIEK